MTSISIRIKLIYDADKANQIAYELKYGTRCSNLYISIAIARCIRLMYGYRDYVKTALFRLWRWYNVTYGDTFKTLMGQAFTLIK